MVQKMDNAALVCKVTIEALTTVSSNVKNPLLKMMKKENVFYVKTVYKGTQI